jgi:hypothetical protein
MAVPEQAVIEDPAKAAMEELAAEEAAAKALESPDGEAKEPKDDAEGTPEKETADTEPTLEETAAAADALAKKAVELGLPETATADEIQAVEESRQEEAKQARDEKIAKLKLKAESTDEEIKAAEDKSAKEDLEKEVGEYAVSNNLPIEEARKEVEAVRGIVSKYDNNPHKIAKAYKSSQAEYAKLKSENEALKTAAPKIIALTENEIMIANQVFSKEKVIEAYRTKYPEETEDMTESQILFSAKKEFEVEAIKAQSQAREQQKSAAETRKTEMLSALGAQDKKFEKGIKAMLDASGIDVILGDKEGRLAVDYARYIKGEHYEEREKQHAEELKAAKEKAFKTGQESVKAKSGPGGKGSSFSGKQSVSLSAAEKRRAIEMYGRVSDSDEDAYKSFIEVGLEEYRKEQK